MSVATFDLLDLVRPVGRWLKGRAPRVWTRIRGMLHDLRILLGGKLTLFVIVDLLLFFGQFFAVLTSGGKLPEIYLGITQGQMFLIGVPALASLLAADRRAGSLDLALAVPSTVRFFVLRAASVAGVLLVQAWIVLLAGYVQLEGGFARTFAQLPAHGAGLVRALVQATLALALLAAVALFWSVRAKGAGAVMVATAATLLAFTPWWSRSPTYETRGGRFAGVPLEHLAWGFDAALLAAAVAIFFLYARQRLRRPETLLVG